MVMNKERLMQNTKGRKKSCLTTTCNSRQWFWPMDELLRCRLAFYFPVYQFLITKYLFLITKWRFQALLGTHCALLPDNAFIHSQWEQILFPVRQDQKSSAPRLAAKCTHLWAHCRDASSHCVKCTNAFLLMIQYQSKTAQKFIPWLPELWHPCQNSATGELLPTQTHQNQWWSPSQSSWLNNGKNKRSYRMWKWTTTWAVVSKYQEWKTASFSSPVQTTQTSYN